jgi:biopolymer transport protein ExbB
MVKRTILSAAFLLATLAPATASAQGWWNGDWAERHKITLNAGALRGVTEEVKRPPVLVRLHSGVLDFSKVKPDGSDLRFIAADGKTPLNYHIERFDPSAEIALVWVDVPSVAPGASQEIWLYYGSAGAKPAANPGASYDGEQSLVQHLSENGTPADATANANRVTASTARPTLEGLIGGGATFAADSQIRIAPSQSLGVADQGKMSFSAWIKPGTQSMPADAAVYTKLSAGGEAAPQKLVLGLRAGAPYVRLVGQDGTPAEAVSGAALPGGSWAHLAVTAGDGKVTLYVNGAAVGTLDAQLPALAGEDVIGAAAGLPSFVGDADEIGRANVARSASAIALAAESQNRSSGFATVAAEAETSAGGGHNYLGILVSALTPDAWAVILILGVMALISWFVMILKGRLVMQTAGANRGFLTSYQNATKGQGAHTGLNSADIASSSPASSLARLFQIGQQELKLRLAELSAVRGERHAIAPQSIAAIRSALDAGQAREEQRLNKWMVLLTIAIAGGPFLGLLGTVVGVMITFAGVAAAGDVNINAIAPGIAAALLATVAGLAVAIPALFGYNYLQSRIEEIDTDNRIFVDELEKRIAETYRPSAPAALAAE